MSILVVCSCKAVYSQKKPVCPKCGSPKKERGTRYQVVIREGGRGTRKHTRFANTLAEAKEAEQRIRNQLSNNINPRAARKGITVGEIFRRYIMLAQHPNADEYKTSWKKDEQRWRDYLAASFDNRRLDAICRQDILDFLTALEKRQSRVGKPLAPATRRHALHLMQRLYNWAREQNIYTGYNPTAKVAVTVINDVGRVLQPVEIQAFLTGLASLGAEGRPLVDRMCALGLLFALLTGRRLGEICTLRRDKANQEDEEATFWDEKNNKWLTVPISPESLAIIQQADMIGLKDADLVFHREEGKGIYNQMEYRWEKLRDTIGLSGFRIHDFRHTFATWTKRKIGLLASMGLTGHTTITNARRYEHTDDDVLRRGVAAVAERAGLRNGAQDDKQTS
ncbi:MAG: site-specific integrase [Proteobacteria bacterium]|nr:site-specific integrase [Pseudomonadota bacterium]